MSERRCMRMALHGRSPPYTDAARAAGLPVCAMSSARLVNYVPELRSGTGARTILSRGRTSGWHPGWHPSTVGRKHVAVPVLAHLARAKTDRIRVLWQKKCMSSGGRFRATPKMIPTMDKYRPTPDGCRNGSCRSLSSTKSGGLRQECGCSSFVFSRS